MTNTLILLQRMGQWNQAQCFNMGCNLGEDRL